MTFWIPAWTSIYCTADRITPKPYDFFFRVNRAERLKLRATLHINININVNAQIVPSLFAMKLWETLHCVVHKFSRERKMHKHAQSAETLAVCALGRILKGPFDRNWALDKMAVLFAYRQLNKQQTESQRFRDGTRVCSQLFSWNVYKLLLSAKPFPQHITVIVLNSETWKHHDANAKGGEIESWGERWGMSRSVRFLLEHNNKYISSI